jgi:ubiquitin C-terminal hydrolase
MIYIMSLGISKYRNDNGVSCYINSILHILQQIPIFTDWLVTDNFLNTLKTETESVTFELARIFKLSLSNENITITPNTFKKVISMKNNLWGECEQQDAQEFLIFLLSQIEEEVGIKQIKLIPGINNYDNTKINKNDLYNLICLNQYHKSLSFNFSILKNLFVGYTTSNIKCCYCNTSSPRLEEFITLSLDIPDNKLECSLYDCFDNTFKEEQLDNENKIYCEFCGIKNKSIKQIKLWKTPYILIIQFKRFKLNKKITTNINYPIYNFNIDKYFDNNTNNFISTSYKLLAINIHEELAFKSIDVGHYTSIVLNRYDNNYYLFNDSNEPLILNNSNLQNSNAYLLFYIKSESL